MSARFTNLHQFVFLFIYHCVDVCAHTHVCTVCSCMLECAYLCVVVRGQLAGVRNCVDSGHQTGVCWAPLPTFQ